VAASSPLIENQRHVAGFMSPFGSQKDDAGTRQRRCSNDVFQKALFRIVFLGRLPDFSGAFGCALGGKSAAALST
jgi:hypothetical protein